MIADLLKLKFKIPLVFLLKRGENQPRDKQKQRRQHRHTAGNQRRETRHKPRFRKLHQHGNHKSGGYKRQNQRQQTEKCKRLVVLVQPGDGQQHLCAILIRVELGFAAIRPVPIGNHDIADLHPTVDGVNGHVGLDFKPFG